MSRSRCFDSVLPHPLKMQFNAGLDAAQSRVESLARGYASGKIWNRCTPVAIGILAYSHKILKLFHG